MTKLAGYSVLYTFAGYFGFYKLTIQFTQFVTKVPPGIYNRPICAAYLDYTLGYLFGKIKQESVIVTFLMDLFRH